MSSGMNTEQAKEYAKTMTYSEAISNVKYGKCIKYRKATMIKLRELAEIADRLDKINTPQTEELKCRNERYYKSCEYKDNCNPTVCFKALDEFQEAVTDCEACELELDGKADICKICRVSNYEPQTDCPWK